MFKHEDFVYPPLAEIKDQEHYIEIKSSVRLTKKELLKCVFNYEFTTLISIKESVNFLEELHQKLMEIPACYGVDGYDIDRVGQIHSDLKLFLNSFEKEIDEKGL